MDPMSTDPTRRATHTPGLVLAGFMLLSLNLRPAATAVGPVLGDIRADLGLSATMAGVLTALPGICFGAFGAVAPVISNRIGPHRTIGAALVAMVLGQVARVLVDATAPFLAFTALCMAGMAVSNVLLPSLVRLHFPDRVGFVTALYSATLNLGPLLAGSFTAPLALWWGGWRQAMWAWVGTTLLACLPWLLLVRADRAHAPVDRHAAWGLRHVVRTPLGWAMALFFACQSGQAYIVFGWLASMYVDAGATPSFAGLMLGLATGLSIPLGFIVPMIVSSWQHPHRLLWVFGVSGVAAYIGLMTSPLTLPWLWALLMAVGLSGFPFFLALLGGRARTSDGVAVLSAFSQGIGYLLASVGPFLFGALRGLTGGYDASAVMAMALFVPLVLLGLVASRDRFIEDELERATR